MRSRVVIADVFRSIARALTDFLVPMIIFYLLFVGLQLGSGEGGFYGLTLNIILLLLMPGGFVIAWRSESLGAAVALGALAAFVLAGHLASGFSATFSTSPLVWPLALLVALIKPQSFDPMPTWIILASWAILVAPICLFLASRLLRKST